MPPRGSVAASVQAAVPDCQVAAAFHHVPAKELGDLDQPIESDVLICSDSPRGHRRRRGHRWSQIPNMRPLDAGELSHATPIEAFTAVLLQLNVHYKTRVALKFTGIPRSSRAHAPVRHGPQGGRAVRARSVVTMYTCGITPYDATHLGHAAVYVTYDVLQRRLRDLGHDTRCVRNITDVDDSILAKARSSACTTSTSPRPRRRASTAT